mmetsp:Transcript_61082/g.71456  ORF Transcript_61082/g.71456 Transcript_61082/m.71456 type:complete len:82 (+) Transcript_61082:795-1040(+)
MHTLARVTTRQHNPPQSTSEHLTQSTRRCHPEGLPSIAGGVVDGYGDAQALGNVVDGNGDREGDSNGRIGGVGDECYQSLR